MINIDAATLHFGLKGKKYMLELSKSVKPEYFVGKYQDLYSILCGAFANPNIKDILGITAIMDYCDRHSLASKKDQIRQAYIDAQQIRSEHGPLQESEFGYFVELMKERYNVAVVQSAIKRVGGIVGSGIGVAEANDVLKETLQEVASIHKSQVFDEGSLGEDIVNIYKEYEEISTRPEQFKGVLSGFPSLDAATNGFFGGELIIIAGFEGSGKSLVSMNIAVNAWLGSNDPMTDSEVFADDGKNVVYFSLEMPRSNKGEPSSAANLNKRMVSCIGKIGQTPLRQGILDEQQKERFKKACKFIKKYDSKKKLYVVDVPRGATVEDIEIKYLELQEKFPVDMIVVDYIGLMAGAEDESDWEAQGKIAEGLHELARTYRIPVISPVQLNRPSGANHSLNKQNYNNTRIARSAMITQNANIVLVIEFRDNEHEYPDMPIKITKMRDGAKGDLLLMKDFANMRVYDMLTAEAPREPTNFVDLGSEEDD